MKNSIACLALLALLHCGHGSHHNHTPQQIHLSLGYDETEMIVTWVTLKEISDKGHVEYGLEKKHLTNNAKAEVTHFKEDKTEFYTYRAVMTGLTPGVQYHYRVGSKDSKWSDSFHFRTLPKGNDWNPKLAIYGDLGWKDDESLPFLVKEVHDNDAFDTVFHIGDFAYDLHDKDGEKGHKFMNAIEPIAARVPYMVLPGNHEKHDNFSHYEARFSMIGDRFQPNRAGPLTPRINNHFSSMNIGPAHIIMFSTEFYYYTKYGWSQIENQFRFLEQDLIQANSERSQRPWIIVMGHRPMYCLKELDEEDLEECDGTTLERPFVRTGIHMNDDKQLAVQFGLEDLFYKYGVDIHFYGHEHLYGRLFPVYNGEIKSGLNKANPYDNPSGPIHIITGSAGNKKGHPKFNAHPKDWLAYHHLDFGYTRLTFQNRTNIILEQTSDEKNGQILDRIEIIKNTDQPKWMI